MTSSKGNSLVVQLLLKDRNKEERDEKADESEAESNNDCTVMDLSSESKKRKQQMKPESMSPKITMVQTEPMAIITTDSVDKSTSNSPNYSLDKALESTRKLSRCSPDGSLRCSLCNFVAESSRMLFQHYAYHQQSMEEKVPDADLTVISDSAKDPDMHSSPPSSSQLSLRQLLQKKESNTSPASHYLRSIVKAVMSEKSTQNNEVNMSYYRNVVGYPSNRQGQCDRVTPYDYHSKDMYLSGLPLIGELVNPITSPESVCTSQENDVINIALKSEPVWENDETSRSYESNLSNREYEQDYPQLPEPIKGYVTFENTHRLNKRKRKPVHLSEHFLSETEQCISDKRRSPFNKTMDSPYVTSTSSKMGDKTRNKAVQCDLGKSSSKHVSHPSTNKCEVKEAQENPPVGCSESHTCVHCGIWFNDEVLYSIHMGCHSLAQPFSCNVCGKHCKDKYAFYTHIMRGHQYS